jgi:formate-dependent nitrite reductase membrane component NrfD
MKLKLKILPVLFTISSLASGYALWLLCYDVVELSELHDFIPIIFIGGLALGVFCIDLVFQCLLSV